jgi:hypothetical protein
MKQDRLVGIGLLVVSAILLRETFSFPVNEWEPLGMAFWPRILLGALSLIGVYLIVRGSLDEGPFERLKSKAFAALLAGVGYVLLLPYIGYAILTPLFLFLTSLALTETLDGRRLAESGLMAVAGSIVVYLVFQYGLLVQLPEGLLE